MHVKYKEVAVNLNSNDNNRRTGYNKKWNKKVKRFIILFTFFFVFLLSNYLTVKFFDGQDKFLDVNVRKNYYNKKVLIPNFVNLYTNDTNGPITVDKRKADDDRFNFKQMILENNEKDFKSFYYDLKGFKNLKKVIKREDYLCESESKKGYDIVCPTHYTINIDEAFYGRYANDNTHCKVNTKGEAVESKKLEITETCGNDTINIVKKICEGRVDCNIKPNKAFFGNPCNMDIYKYLHIKYRCVKNEEFKKPEFAVVMFTDRINVNTIYENAISEFYQYCKIHNYTLMLNTQRYDTETSIFYMKLHVIKEAIVKGLKTHKYDWIFWIDSDVILANPNIKLETFLPNDENIHFVIATDHHGLNAGVFMIKVHPWSLNFMMHSIAYQFFINGRHLEYADQTSMNDVLILNDDIERAHYAVVPQNWFNSYPDRRHSGDMVLHFAGRKNKKKDSMETRLELKNDPNYLKDKTNKQMREEALEFYAQPIENQKKLVYVDYGYREKKKTKEEIFKIIVKKFKEFFDFY
ncbi:hypothetical protein BCR32DRAFT_289774 [Anaeromyces robustus]|uniref:SUEL-type lectin domain-containing protein n=1 Tax=Anaeromyces robustus TaxID=1754192 RepID=A0A1Y1XMB1_9FUNG|nr:hypothetical protein BCR32DRAFT_289774 [Anaeromyces robustus]|eukprot:ORX86843.1 hypothetical protein BCR32DRAFT_289774 [Anaeromyces robustus]